MPDKEFLNGIAFSNLAGSRFTNFINLARKHKVARAFYWRAILNGFISFILSILSLGDKFVYFLVKKKQKQIHAPVFILGHWRSGTTHLHNLMCLDHRFGYTTTFQTVFPNHLFGFKKPLLWLMRKMMPATRPVDNVPLDPLNPQEEEFGLGNVMDICYYNWWYFPADWTYYMSYQLDFSALEKQDIERWKKTYLTFIKRGLLEQNKNWYISKNPPNTARIPQLLELFPDARFVYIQRNPYEVIVSSQRFFKAILHPLQLQHISEHDFTQNILKAYCLLFDAFEEQKKIIPKKHLVEINYENFLQNELSYLQYIYSQLGIKIPAGLVPIWKEKINAKKHAKKEYPYTTEFLTMVNNALGDRIEKMGYEKLTVSNMP